MNETNNWLQMSLQLRGSVAVKVLPRALMSGIFGFLVSLLHYFELPLVWNNLGSIVANVVFNLVLGLLLVFRTNTSYDRFWEGRKAWGALVVNIRNLARQIKIGIMEKEAIDREEKNRNLRLLAAFAVATKLHLRREPMDSELESLVSPSQFVRLKQVKNPPLEILSWIGNYLQKQTERDCLSRYQLTAMNELLDKLVEGLTSCERILTTPIPLAYTIYLKRLLLIYCIFLPFQLLEKAGWLTGLLVALISYVLFGIEEIGNEIQDPFGHDPNDLPLDKICQTILNNVEDVMQTIEGDSW